MDEIAARAAFDNALVTSRQDFETFFLSRLFGLAYRYDGEALTVEFPIYDFLFNPQGWVHGGVSAFVLDVTMGHLLWHVSGLPATTLEMKTQFLAPLRGSKARCVAGFIRKGKSINFMEARLYDDSGTVTVAATSTWRITKPKSHSTSKSE